MHTVMASGAVGSLREKIAPGHLVLVDQFIDKTFRRAETFFDGYGAVHCECPSRLRAAEALGHVAVARGGHDPPDGTYVCMEGPLFSTRAESLMHRQWGADLIGMTAMPEAKLARQAQMCYAMIALVSDYDCWRPHEASKGKQTLLKEILSNLKTATNNCLALIEALRPAANRSSTRIAPAARAWRWRSGRARTTSIRTRKSGWRFYLNDVDRREEIEGCEGTIL